ncbi:MAG: hypothetical protein C0467_31605 [Planctomycetaceae bacterium]|nr:hypothetical protein [Planctomycetaceae bacterium]
MLPNRGSWTVKPFREEPRLIHIEVMSKNSRQAVPQPGTRLARLKTKMQKQKPPKQASKK